jgi:hypothetical protein
MDEEPDFADLIQGYIRHLAVEMEELKGALEKGHWDVVGRISHNIKGGGGGFGFPMLTRVAGNIQYHLTAGDYQGLQQSIEEMDQLCQRIYQGAV